MAYYKPSFVNLSARFGGESQRNMAAGNKKESPGTKELEQVLSFSRASVNAELNAMVHDVWEEIFGHVLRSHPLIMEHLFSAASSKADDNPEVKVVKEVFKREMIIALEGIYESRLRPNSKEKKTELFKERKDSLDSHEHSLKDMTRKATEAEESLQIVIKEKQDLKNICEGYKEEQQKVTKMLHDAREEIETLRANNVSLANSMKLLNTEIKDLREAKGAEEANALRSQHDAEMAHLIAKQSVLQAKLLDKQLREAESSSNIVHKRVEELQNVQNEMRRVLFTRSRPSGSHVAGAQNDSPVYRNARPHGQLGMAQARRKQRLDAGETKGKTRTENHRSPRARVNVEGSSPPTTANQSRSSDSRNRNAREVHQRMQRRFTRGWRVGSNEERRGAGVREEKRRTFSQFLNLGRGAPSNVNREAAVDQGIGRIPWVAGLKRLLSPRTYYETRNVRRPVGTAPHTLEALGENLEVLRDVVDNKQKEVDRLRGELRAATLQSDALERRLRKEQHKRIEMKVDCSGDTCASSATDTTSSGAPGNGEGVKSNSGEEVSRR
ncbi:hypothetical protein FGB62_16g254 [Gracilaria domingensis]|nr:hypothetical protein FGB62_16g254 [Gracilaria domingensis]